MIVQRLLSGLSALLLAAGAVQGVRGGWIHSKAHLAQALLHRSWERTQAGGVEEKPWPWADTWPVARLTLPGGGTCVIAGHRDTHFSDLDGLEKGQVVTVEDEKGWQSTYLVTRTAVVEDVDTWVITENEGPTLVLVTCWPLDSLLPGGTQRYVVWAEAGPAKPVS